jgi:hypothetical protein
MSVDGGEQADDFQVRVVAEDVQRPRAVFAATPRQKDLLLQSADLKF